jgi:H+/Cl- antiporter ClcA
LTQQIARVAAVIALLGIAAALATPKGRLPLALRGVLKVMRRDRGECAAQHPEARVPAWRRALAFLLVLAAAALALW